MTERHKFLSVRGMTAKMAANGIRTHARINQRHNCQFRLNPIITDLILTWEATW